MFDYKEVKISDLKLNENNPRKNDKASDRLIDGIKKYGFINPIIVNKNNNKVIAGHTRIKAMLKLGKKTIPAIFVDMDEATEKGFSIFDNKSAEFASWDNDLLKVELEELQELDFDLELTGFEDWEIEDILGNEDEASYEKEEIYTAKVEPPIYEPQLETPPKIGELYDSKKRDALIDKIRKLNIKDEELEKFLLYSAERFTQFNFTNIAEFYAHQEKDIQEIMEDLALVIIDYNKAIENGFIKAVEGAIEIAKDEEIED